MSLDIYLEGALGIPIWEANVTHNLGVMADIAGLHGPLWRPEENGITKASQLIPLLEKGIAAMRADPAKFIAFNPKNGWGSYDRFLPWLDRLLEACRNTPDATVRASR